MAQQASTSRHSSMCMGEDTQSPRLPLPHPEVAGGPAAGCLNLGTRWDRKGGDGGGLEGGAAGLYSLYSQS